ncbi:MAG: hypothetical protein A2007_05120 [Verrucomicrobia bacterium GWC2_42_7]|nr:MAG: hypothetical protein A2007_05120 [Verrucomicrobia bacterium GWC2_42_7]
MTRCENLSFAKKEKNIKIRAFQIKTIMREQKTTLFFAQRGCFVTTFIASFSEGVRGNAFGGLWFPRSF